MKYAVQFEGTSPRYVGPFDTTAEAVAAGERIAERRGSLQVWSVVRMVSAADADGLPETHD